MEFTHGRRDIRFSCEEEEQEEDTKHQVLRPSSSSSSSSSNNGIRWGQQPEAGDGPSAPPLVEREHMFDKVVTPSDVGKLNRLVIPKQHAEKYFPLDASANEKGLLLGFEDRNGKPWRFRYSYWNSSQSYVMTKGWSRFVKEKRLDAGDTVSFGRGVGEAGRDRLFIDWKRRPEALLDHPSRLQRLPLPGGGGHHYPHHPLVSFTRSPPCPWGGRLFVPPAAVYEQQYRQSYGCNSNSSGSGQFLYFRSAAALPQISVQPRDIADGNASMPLVLDSVPLVHSQAAAKRVRLFGVNLDCPESDGEDNNGTVRSQRVPQFQPRSPLPPLQLRLGRVESNLAATHPEDNKSPLDLEL